MIPIRPKVNGTARVTHVCRACGKSIESEPVLVTRDGQLVAYHKEHTNGR